MNCPRCGGSIRLLLRPSTFECAGCHAVLELVIRSATSATGDFLAYRDRVVRALMDTSVPYAAACLYW